MRSSFEEQSEKMALMKEKLSQMRKSMDYAMKGRVPEKLRKVIILKYP
jgi:hypothetical protein